MGSGGVVSRGSGGLSGVRGVVSRGSGGLSGVRGVVSRGSGGLSGVLHTAIKAQHGCLTKMDIGGQFGCSTC